MASLKIVAADDAALVGTSIQLSASDLTIGREPDNALVLTDPSVSRHHARIRPGERVVIEDQGSSTGVLVNDLRVTRHELLPGDRIQMGRTVFLFEGGSTRCGACGSVLDADARFCPACGAPVRAPRPIATPAPAPTPPVSPSRGRWPLWLGIGLLAALLVGSVPLVLHLRASKRAPPRTAAPSTAAPLAPELEAAARFRGEVAGGWDAAVQRVASPDAARRLRAIGETIWPDPKQTAGWVYLLQTSLICPGARSGDWRPVAYYHPWSDVFLIMVWESRDDTRGPRIVDAELLMGDFVRRRGQPKLATGRPPAYEQLYQPLSVGIWAAETVRAFEGAFGAARSDNDWRAAIPGLADENLLRSNRVGAGVQIAANLAPLGLLALPAHDARATRQVRAALKQLLDAARAGRTAEHLSRARVLEETRAELGRLRLEGWERFKPVGYSMGPSRSLVLLSQADGTDRYLALVFARDAAAARLERVDLLSFKVFYRDLAALKRRVGL